MSQFRLRVAQLLDVNRDRTWKESLPDWFLQGLIILNVLAIILGSVDSIQAEYQVELDQFEWFSVMIFTLEYLVRLWSSVDLWGGTYASPVRGRLRYMLTPMAIIDLVAILPFYLTFFFSFDLRFLRAVRLLRMLKLTRYWSALDVMFAVFREEARSIAAGLFVLTLLLVLVSSGIYVIEEQAQPDDFGSIPAAMWWAMATLTTVGYGDVTPLTPMGKFFGALVTVLGVGMAALPTAILASGFTNELARRKEEFKNSAETAFEDGVLTREEERALQDLRSSLGLSESDAEQMLLAAARDSLGLSGERADQLVRLALGGAELRDVKCPRCDHRFNPSR